MWSVVWCASLVCSFSLPEFGVISVRFNFSESKKEYMQPTEFSNPKNKFE